MKKIKVFFDWFLRANTSILVVLFLIFAPFTVMPSLLAEEANVNKSQTFEYQGILELWHIETFEGGSQSRAHFLEWQARKFENIHKGTYVSILTMSPEQFKINFDAGKTPNIISFGTGIGSNFAHNLISLQSQNAIKTNLLLAGSISGQQLALPYILGGYVLAKKPKTNLQDTVTGIGLKGLSNPLECASKNNLKLKIFDEKQLDSYSTYDKFLKGYFDNLLGTQRDLFRIQNRQQKGLLTDFEFEFLPNYTDLVQFVSVFQTQKAETEMSKQFAEFLTSDEAQNDLAKIGMFSVTQTKLYDDEPYAKMEEVLSQNLQVQNAFLDATYIDSQKESLYAKFDWQKKIS